MWYANKALCRKPFRHLRPRGQVCIPGYNETNTRGRLSCQLYPGYKATNLSLGLRTLSRRPEGNVRSQRAIAIIARLLRGARS
jgi:hypothetical protein